MRKRTVARELALQVLYQQDLRSKAELEESPREDLDAFIEDSTDDPKVKEFARSIVDGTLCAQEEIDHRIAAVAKNWKLSRIAPIDRCILRMALFELLKSGEVPPKVAINEAINLAKKYSTEQSGAFVNGILDKVYNDLRES